MDSRYPLVAMESFLTQRKEFFRIDDDTEYDLVTVQLHGRGIRHREQKFGREIKTKRQQMVRVGELLVAEIDAKAGGYGLVPPEAAGSIVSSHYYLYEIDEQTVEPRFLEYYLKSGQPEFDIQQFVQGSLNYAAIRPYQFPQLEIPLPPLEEQRRIVARLDGLTARIEQALALQEAAIEERIEWFKATQRVLFDRLAAKYEVTPLEELIDFRKDLIRPKDRLTGSIRFIGLQHIEPNTGRRLGEDTVQIEDLTGRKFRFSPGEIVYGYLRPYLNKVWIADCDGLCSVDQYVIRPNSSLITTEYLAYAMRSPYFLKQSEELTGVLMLPRLRVNLLQKIRIPVPPLDQQSIVVNLLNELYGQFLELSRLQEVTVQELTAMQPSILDKAFKGEL